MDDGLRSRNTISQKRESLTSNLRHSNAPSEAYSQKPLEASASLRSLKKDGLFPLQAAQKQHQIGSSAAGATKVVKSTDKFRQLMQKDWNDEFAAVHENLGKLNQRTQEEKELKKDPVAYM